MEIHVMEQRTSSTDRVEVKSEWECDVVMPLENRTLGCSDTDTSNVAKQNPDDYFDDSLDDIVLSEREKMLFSRLLGTSSDLTSSSDHGQVKSEIECDVTMSLENGLVSCSNTDTSNIAKLDLDHDFDGSLDDNVPSERRKMLLPRLLVTSSDPITEAKPAVTSVSSLQEVKTSVLSESTCHKSVSGVQDDSSKPANPPSRSGFSQQSRNSNQEALVRNDIPAPLKVKVEDLDLDKLEHLPLSARSKLAPFGITSQQRSHGSQQPLTLKTTDSLKPPSASNFIEKSLDNGQTNVTSSPKAVSAFPSLSGVKVEPLEDMYFENDVKSGAEQLSFDFILSTKPKTELPSEVLEDELDHMPLIDRIKLLSSETSSTLISKLRNGHLNSEKSSRFQLRHNASESVKPINFAYPRKQRKIAVESPQKALEEDAPELWKVLVENGISTEEMKLYGEPESDVAIDDALCEGSFAELEAVIWKVFAQRPSLLKLGPTSRTGISKTSYCVGCLLSLVEQAQFLKRRKWPVEWGWSRDLRAFIFVFQDHYRIVLERPEYGFATYFFEMDTYSIGWQIRRLLIAMRLTNGRRVAMLENKPLIVGEDISAGEARVLEKFGWVPNTGLGTMLNYSDRVVHDIKNERNGAEWRLKIKDLLIKGFMGGVIVPRFHQVKNEEVQEDLLDNIQEVDLMDNTREIKLELI